MQWTQIVYRTTILGILLILTGVLGGCSKDSLAPFQLEIGNIQDSFQL